MNEQEGGKSKDIFTCDPNLQYDSEFTVVLAFIILSLFVCFFLFICLYVFLFVYSFVTMVGVLAPIKLMWAWGAKACTL